MTQVASDIADLLANHPPGRGSLIPLLQDLQKRDGFVSAEAVGALARATGISRNEIYGVATFYAQFRFTPPPEHTIHVCEGTACHVRGSKEVLADFETRLKIRPGQSTPDRKVGLERVACVGCCALAPVVVVDGAVHAAVKPKMVRKLLSELIGKPAEPVVAQENDR
jgi:NADH-quinone oxidoreductase subunit E